MAAATPNRLVSEPSLYLRQHAHNPVDWYPWGPEALRRARVEEKPILLSIGYSSCHWCHVMERECFENPEIASAMNAGFVCIKVDREERPDLDDVYMRVVQILTGRGGWPMTVFLLSDLRPFYAGTYFPPEDRGGMPGLPRVLAAVSRAFSEERDKLEANGAHLVRLLEEENQLPAGATVVPASRAAREAFAEARSALARSMDPEFGGFGRAPKFPSAASLNFLLGLERTDPDPAVHRLLRTTLDRMADGGIYDHLAGGFHRYSVDRSWLIPHFEKMLYDQAQLAETYAEAWIAFGEDRYAETAIGVLDYVAREMTGEHHGFFASRDADSEEEEGKFYLWSTEDVRALLAGRHAEVVCYFFDVTEAGNFESRNILHRMASIEQAAGVFGVGVGELKVILERARSVMYEARKRRVGPVVDTKILADWNGLMLGAMASTARRLGRVDLVARAAQAADFVRSKMIDGRTLKHFCAEGEARVDGFLDDYAFFGRGCLELFQALGRKEDLDSALLCADAILSRFEDKERGGFFRTRDGDQDLLVRARQTYEGATPSGASVAVELLCRLHQLTGMAEYERAARAALDVMLPTALANPHGAAHLLSVAHRALLGYTTVVVVEASGDAARAKALSDAVLRTHAPECSVFSLRPPPADWLPRMMQDKAIPRAESLAYVCRGHTCEPPVNDAETLITAVRQVS